MEKLYLGVDLHKRSCWVTMLDAHGQVVESGKLGTEKWELLGYFEQVRKPAALAVEATFNWYYFLNVVEPLGLELHLVHPWKTRAIASARIKHDKLDSRVLAELLRTGFLAEAWIAPREVRERRQWLRYRVHTEITQEIHSLRASAVIPSLLASAGRSPARASRKSAGMVWTTPPVIAFLPMDIFCF